MLGLERAQLEEFFGGRERSQQTPSRSSGRGRSGGVAKLETEQGGEWSLSVGGRGGEESGSEAVDSGSLGVGYNGESVNRICVHRITN